MQIPLSEFDLLQSCQKIIDAAHSMQCLQCKQVFLTTDFYDHIIVQRECMLESEQQSPSNQVQLGNTDGHIMDSNYFDNLNNTENGNAMPHMESMENSQPVIMKSSLLKSIQDGEGFYEALNMPLQTKIDATNYQTEGKTTDQEPVEEEGKEPERHSSPYYLQR